MSAPLALNDAALIARLCVAAAKACKADPACVLHMEVRLGRSTPEGVANAAARRSILRFIDAKDGPAAAKGFALARQWSGSENAAAQMLSTARREISPDHPALALLEAVGGTGPLPYRPTTRPRAKAGEAKPAAQKASPPSVAKPLRPEPLTPKPEASGSGRNEVIQAARAAGKMRKAEMELALLRRKRQALADNKLAASRTHPGYDDETRARIRTLLAKGVKDVTVRPQVLERFGPDEALRRARSRARGLSRRGYSLATIGVVVARECGVYAGSA